MALEPRIPLALTQPINVGQRFGQALQNVRQFDALQQQRQQTPFQNQLLQLQTELAQAQQPAMLQQAQQAANPLSQVTWQQQQMLQLATISAQNLKPAFDSNSRVGVISGLTALRDQLTTAGAPQQQIAEIEADIAQANTPEGFEALRQENQQFLQQVSGQQTSVSQREFEDKVALVKADPKLETVEGKAAAVSLGIAPRAGISAAERIATDPKLTTQIAESQAEIAGATEETKLKKREKFEPKIRRAVKLAEKAATERGDVLNDMERMEASLPGVREVVEELLVLSEAATSTLLGRAFDTIVKESGFGSTKGADARAKLIAIVDNQVLPLLKETFGAAFTVQEGENLKASLVDPNASPSQKREQLNAFLAQKERNVRTKQQQLNLPQQGVDEFKGFKVVR